MQYLWLEKLEKQGSIRPEVKEEIYNICSEILKVASSKTADVGSASTGELLKMLKGVSPSDLAAGMGMGVKVLLEKYTPTLLGAAAFTMGGNYLGKKLMDSSAQKEVLKVRSEIAKNPDFAAYKDKALARFDELASYSPRAASNLAMATNVIKSHLHSGFTSADIQRWAIHNSLKKSPTIDAKSYEKKTSKMDKKAMVSEEALGETLADMLCLVKESSAANFSTFEKMKGMSGHIFSTIAALTGTSLLAGLATGSVNALKDKMDKKKLRSQLETSFHEAMRQSDPSREPLHANQVKARQAFETLAHFSPRTATSPAAARAFMNTMVAHDLGTNTSTIKELSEIEKNLKMVRQPSPFFTGFAAGTHATGLGSTVSQTSKSLLSPVVEHNTAELDELLYNRAESHQNLGHMD